MEGSQSGATDGEQLSLGATSAPGNSREENDGSAARRPAGRDSSCNNEAFSRIATGVAGME